jgi:outer membrane protein
MKTLLWIAAAPGLALAQANMERLTVEDAVQSALRRSEQVQASRERHAAAEDTADSSRGHLLPRISVSDSEDWFKSPLKITVPGLASGAQATTIEFHDLRANLLQANAAQPLLGLLHLSQSWRAAVASAEGASHGVRASEAAMREGVRVGYLRLFEAKAQKEIALASESQLEDQLKVAKAKFDAGALTTADLLRIQVAAANAKQQQIQAEVQERTTRASLLALLSRDPNDPSVEFVEPTELENAPLPQLDERSAEETALSRRPEVKQAEATASAAKHDQDAALYQILPEVNLTASVIHATGSASNSAFPAVDAAYIGLGASWPIWEWGATWFAHRSAAHHATAARLQAEDTRRQVSVDATNKLETAKAAGAAVEVAQATIASAEEAYRVTEALVKVGSATTTDLLDSQSALSQAKLNLVRAKYEQAIALVSLRRAMGE